MYRLERMPLLVLFLSLRITYWIGTVDVVSNAKLEMIAWFWSLSVPICDIQLNCAKFRNFIYMFFLYISRTHRQSEWERHTHKRCPMVFVARHDIFDQREVRAIHIIIPCGFICKSFHFYHDQLSLLFTLNVISFFFKK